jgi:hypothetical protein
LSLAADYARLGANAGNSQPWITTRKTKRAAFWGGT